MINLLPTDFKRDILYARRNTRLLKWSIALVFVIIGMGIIIGGGYAYMQGSIKRYSADVEKSRDSLKLQKLEETQTRLEGISSSLKLVVQVLGKQILFSKLIQQIGSAMPPNTVLTGLKIEKVQGSLTITAQATDIQAATQVQVNLSDPKNKIFEKADIENVQCGGEGRYPCSVQIKALFAKNNDFYFISPGASR